VLLLLPVLAVPGGRVAMTAVLLDVGFFQLRAAAAAACMAGDAGDAAAVMSLP
jgi:hypothetical protein